MSTQAQDAAAMTGYLLGSLSEAETERLDELSITDADFVCALSAVERDLIDAYVQGELGGAELERFESAYLVSPLRRSKVDFAKALQAFGGREAQPARVPSTFAAVLNLRPALQAALAAAAIVLLGAASWLAVENVRLRQQAPRVQSEQSAAILREQQLHSELSSVRGDRARLSQQQSRVENSGIVALSLAPQMRSAGTRSAGSIPEAPVTADVEYVAVQLELEPSEYTFFRVELLDTSGGPQLWTSGTLAPKMTDRGKTLHITLPARLLTAQPYVLRVTGLRMERAEVIGEYRFKVTKP